MALTKPILNSVVAWDVANGQTFTFNVIGGDAVVGNTLYILDNTTNIVVYTLSTTSFQYKAIVPANAIGLINGTYYSAYVVTTNSNGDLSLPSNTIQFYCYTTPSWAITNISAGSVVNNSSIAPQALYSQAEGEALSDYTFTLYSSSQTQLATSGVKYTGSSASSLTVNYDFFGLEDNTVYYIRATGHTVGGTFIDSGYIQFTVSYILPETFNVLTVQNNCNDGYITYYSLAYVIEGISNPFPPTYIDGKVDLTSLGSWVKWDNNFVVNDNFTMKAWIINPNVNTDLIRFQDVNGYSITVGIYAYLLDGTKVCATLSAYNGLDGFDYFIYSDPIPMPSDNVMLCIQVRRINNIYEVLIEEVEEA